MDRQAISADLRIVVLKIQQIPIDATIEAIACWLHLATGHFPAILCVREATNSLAAVATLKICAFEDFDLSQALTFAQRNPIDGLRPTLEILSMPASIYLYSDDGVFSEAFPRALFPMSAEVILEDCHFARLTIYDEAAYHSALECVVSTLADVRLMSYDLDPSELHVYAFQADDLLRTVSAAAPFQLIANGVPPEHVHTLSEQLRSTLNDLGIGSAFIVFFKDSVLISCSSAEDYRRLKDQATSYFGLQLCGIRLAITDSFHDETDAASSCNVLLHNLGEVTKDEIKYFAWALAGVPVTNVEFVRERSSKELSAFVSFASPFDIGRLCKGLEIIQLSGLTVVAESVKQRWLAVVSDLPANVDPSVVLSILNEAKAPALSCCPTSIPGKWLLTFSSSQDRDAAVYSSRQRNRRRGILKLRIERLYDSVGAADGHRTRRELSLRFLNEGYMQYARQCDKVWLISLLTHHNCESDRRCERVTSVHSRYRVLKAASRRRNAEEWADLRYTLSRAFADRYDICVFPWPIGAWKSVAKLLRSYDFLVEQLRGERERVALLEIAPSAACGTCLTEGVCCLVPDSSGRQACHRDSRYGISLCCMYSPSAALVGLRQSVAALRQLPQMVELLQSSGAAVTVCCVPALAELLADNGGAMTGFGVSLAVDAGRSQVTFIANAAITNQAIALLRGSATPICHCEVPLSRAACALLMSSHSKTATQVRWLVTQSLLANGMSEKLTWMVDSSPRVALLVLFATSEEVLEAGRRLFVELFTEGVLTWPPGCDQSPENDDATWEKLHELCDEHGAAVVLLNPADADDSAHCVSGGSFVAFACRSSFAAEFAAAVRSCLQQVIVTAACDIHPLHWLWLRQPVHTAGLRELQLETRSAADGRISTPLHTSSCHVLMMKGSQAGLANLMTAAASLLRMENLEMVKYTWHVPGFWAYFLTSAEGTMELDRVVKETGVMIMPVRQDGANEGNNVSAAQAGDAVLMPTAGVVEVTLEKVGFGRRWCCLWQGAWIVIQHADLTCVDCDVMVVSSDPVSDKVKYAVKAAGVQDIVTVGDLPSGASEDQPPVIMSVENPNGFRCKVLLCIAAEPVGQLARPEAAKERIMAVVHRVLSAAASMGHRVVALTCNSGTVNSENAFGLADSALLLVSAVKQALLNPALSGRLSLVLLVDESPDVVKFLQSSMDREFVNQPRSMLMPPPHVTSSIALGMSARRQAGLLGHASGELAERVLPLLQAHDTPTATGMVASPGTAAGLANGASGATQAGMAQAVRPHSITVPTLAIGPWLGAQTSVVQLPLRAAQQPMATDGMSGRSLLDATGVVIHLRNTTLVVQEADAYILPTDDLDFTRDKFSREFLAQMQFSLPFGIRVSAGEACGIQAPPQCRSRALIFAACTKQDSPSSNADHLRKALGSALHSADKLNVSTVAFVPPGAGCGTFLAADAAVLAIDAIQSFCRSRLSKRPLRIIIVAPSMELNVAFGTVFADLLTFHMPYGRGVVSGVWRHQDMQKFIDSTRTACRNRHSGTTMVIYGTEDSIVNASLQLLNLCRAKLEKATVVIGDSQKLISFLVPEQVHDLTCSAKMYADDVELWFEQEPSTADSSNGRSVLKMASLNDRVASDMAKELIHLLHEEQAAFAEESNLISSAVWQHRFEPMGWWHNYDARISVLLERAYRASDSLVKYENAAGGYVVNLQSMTDTKIGNESNNVSVVRRLTIPSSDLPSHWHQTNNYMEVSLHADIHAQEFSAVAKAFGSTLGRPPSIVEIVRIQNPTLWKQYALKREDVLRNLLYQPVAERDLWHGAPAYSVQGICREGFNRSFCGKNGICFGQGAYFARNAEYAASEPYAMQDFNNVKCVVLAKVLVGDYEEGHCNMKVTNYKPYTEIPRRFDSSVNSLADPAIFVTYNDAQAYPAYIIKFV